MSELSEKVAAALPCRKLFVGYSDGCTVDGTQHYSNCPAYYRSRVEELLRETVKPWRETVYEILRVFGGYHTSKEPNGCEKCTVTRAARALLAAEPKP